MAANNSSSSTDADTDQSAPIEFRGAWMEAADLLKPATRVAQHYESLRKANFNAVAINCFYGGCAAYAKSRFVPQHPQCKGKPDILQGAIDLLHKMGMGVYLLSGDGFIAHVIDANAPEYRGPYLTAHPELREVDSKDNARLYYAKKAYLSLCPANPATHEYLAGLYAEALLRYNFDGIVLHDLHYWWKNYCFCAYCREHFKEDTGITLGVYDSNSSESKAWMKWKRTQLAKCMATISRQVRAARPGAVVMVYGLLGRDQEDRAQPWETWLRDGSADYVILQLDNKDIKPALDSAFRITGIRRSQLIAGLRSWHPVPDVLESVELAQKRGMAGQLFCPSSGLKNSHLFGFRDGPYAQPAVFPGPK